MAEQPEIQLPSPAVAFRPGTAPCVRTVSSRHGRAGALLVGLALAGLAPIASAQGLAGTHGPAEIRDEQLFAQPRLTLPATSPTPLDPGTWAVRIDGLWSNSFSWDQDVAGESPARRSFLVDGEALSVAANLRLGLRAGWDIGVRLPFRWRGGGAMDGMIDTWHRVFRPPDGQRPEFLTNEFRVEGTLRGGAAFSWTGETGAGLGNAELDTRWLVSGGPNGSVAVIGRLALPTGTGTFSGHGAGAAVQLVADAPLAHRLTFYTGLGGTVQGRGPIDLVEYEPARAHGFLALEWRATRSLSLVGETNAATRLVSNIEAYPGTHWMVDVAARRRLGRSGEIAIGFTENILSQLSTTDFALYAAVALRR